MIIKYYDEEECPKHPNHPIKIEFATIKTVLYFQERLDEKYLKNARRYLEDGFQNSLFSRTECCNIFHELRGENSQWLEQ